MHKATTFAGVAAALALGGFAVAQTTSSPSGSAMGSQGQSTTGPSTDSSMPSNSATGANTGAMSAGQAGSDTAAQAGQSGTAADMGASSNTGANAAGAYGSDTAGTEVQQAGERG